MNVQNRPCRLSTTSASGVFAVSPTFPSRVSATTAVAFDSGQPRQAPAATRASVAGPTSALGPALFQLAQLGRALVRGTESIGGAPGAFRSVAEPERSIQEFMAAWNAHPTSFAWAALAYEILVDRQAWSSSSIAALNTHAMMAWDSGVGRAFLGSVEVPSSIIPVSASER